MKRALITGITGQDGYYLTQHLLAQGYQVFGFAQDPQFTLDPVEMIYGDLCNSNDVAQAIQTSQPNEIYHLASQSRPSVSWQRLGETLRVNAEGAIHVFEAVRQHCPAAKIYQASSSEMFGDVEQTPQNEETPFRPTDPYAAAKLYAHQMAGIYRQRYGLFIACGILFNHESERRPLHFVTQKIAYGAACAALGITDSPDLNEVGDPIVQAGQLALGDLFVIRDWGCAEDYVQAMWLMLQQEHPEDFVIGTGQQHSLLQLCQMAYGGVGLDWQQYVRVDVTLKRPNSSRAKLADPTKAKTHLNWCATTPFSALMHRMVQAQLLKLAHPGTPLHARAPSIAAVVLV